MNDVQDAWSGYFYKSLKESLLAPPTSTSFASARAAWSDIMERSNDAKWLEEQKMREEKWGMHVESLRVGLAAIDLAASLDCHASKDDVARLLEANRDAMSTLLDRKVQLPSF